MVLFLVTLTDLQTPRAGLLELLVDFIKKYLSRTNSIQHKGKHFFQLSQMLQMSYTRLHILSQPFFLKLGTALSYVSIRKRTGFLLLWVL